MYSANCRAAAGRAVTEGPAITHFAPLNCTEMLSYLNGLPGRNGLGSIGATAAGAGARPVVAATPASGVKTPIAPIGSGALVGAPGAASRTSLPRLLRPGKDGARLPEVPASSPSRTRS